jgi:hypothetical protein
VYGSGVTIIELLQFLRPTRSGFVAFIFPLSLSRMTAGQRPFALDVTLRLERARACDLCAANGSEGS